MTHETKLINGVEAVVVHDTAFLDGEKVEFTEDWFAQDTQGNVWYMGEYATEFYPDEPGREPTHSGSWEAGQPVEETDPVQLAQAGYIMKADPMLGNTYNQEYAPGVAEDMGTLLALDTNADIRYGRFEGDVLETKDFSAIDPALLENKFYTPGVGTILAIDNDGAFEQLVRINVDGTAENDSLEGYAGRDVIKGYQGNDTLYGLGGDDKLRGGNGDDTLIGGDGDNTLTGGGGADGFVFSSMSGGGDEDGGENGDAADDGPDDDTQVDLVIDYSKDQGDKLYLERGADSVSRIGQSNGDLELTLEGGNHVLRLDGVTDIADVDFATTSDSGGDWLLA